MSRESDVLPSTRRRREAEQRKRLLIYVAVAAGLLAVPAMCLVGLGVWFLSRPGKPVVMGGPQAVAPPLSGVGAITGRPNPEKEGQEWNHKDLINYLNAKGMNLTGIAGKRHAGMFFFDARSMTEDDVEEMMRKEGVGFMPVGVLLVSKNDSTQVAKDRTGLSPLAWSWGRFEFRATDQSAMNLVSKVKSALGE